MKNKCFRLKNHSWSKNARDSCSSSLTHLMLSALLPGACEDVLQEKVVHCTHQGGPCLTGPELPAFSLPKSSLLRARADPIGASSRPFQQHLGDWNHCPFALALHISPWTQTALCERLCYPSPPLDTHQVKPGNTNPAETQISVRRDRGVINHCFQTTLACPMQIVPPLLQSWSYTKTMIKIELYI